MCELLTERSLVTMATSTPVEQELTNLVSFSLGGEKPAVDFTATEPVMTLPAESSPKPVTRTSSENAGPSEQDATATKQSGNILETFSGTEHYCSEGGGLLTLDSVQKNQELNHEATEADEQQTVKRGSLLHYYRLNGRQAECVGCSYTTKRCNAIYSHLRYAHNLCRFRCELCDYKAFFCVDVQHHSSRVHRNRQAKIQAISKEEQMKLCNIPSHLIIPDGLKRKKVRKKKLKLGIQKKKQGYSWKLAQMYWLSRGQQNQQYSDSFKSNDFLLSVDGSFSPDVGNDSSYAGVGSLNKSGFYPTQKPAVLATQISTIKTADEYSTGDSDIISKLNVLKDGTTVTDGPNADSLEENIDSKTESLNEGMSTILVRHDDNTDVRKQKPLMEEYGERNYHSKQEYVSEYATKNMKNTEKSLTPVEPSIAICKSERAEMKDDRTTLTSDECDVFKSEKYGKPLLDKNGNERLFQDREEYEKLPNKPPKTSPEDRLPVSDDEKPSEQFSISGILCDRLNNVDKMPEETDNLMGEICTTIETASCTEEQTNEINSDFAKLNNNSMVNKQKGNNSESACKGDNQGKTDREDSLFELSEDGNFETDGFEKCSSFSERITDNTVNSKATANGKLVYKCTYNEDCKFVTSFKFSMEHHIYVHMKVKPFTCQVCLLKKRRLQDIKVHFMLKHPNETIAVLREDRSSELRQKVRKGYKVLSEDRKSCQKTRPLGNVGQKKIGRKKFSCTICNFTCKLQTKYWRHLSDDHQMKRYQCSYCSFQHCFHLQVVRHIRIRHKGNTVKVTHLLSSFLSASPAETQNSHLLTTEHRNLKDTTQDMSLENRNEAREVNLEGLSLSRDDVSPSTYSREYVTEVPRKRRRRRKLFSVGVKRHSQVTKMASATSTMATDGQVAIEGLSKDKKNVVEENTAGLHLTMSEDSGSAGSPDFVPQTFQERGKPRRLFNARKESRSQNKVKKSSSSISVKENHQPLTITQMFDNMRKRIETNMADLEGNTRSVVKTGEMENDNTHIKSTQESSFIVSDCPATAVLQDSETVSSVSLAHSFKNIESSDIKKIRKRRYRRHKRFTHVKMRRVISVGDSRHNIPMPSDGLCEFSPPSGHSKLSALGDGLIEDSACNANDGRNEICSDNVSEIRKNPSGWCGKPLNAFRKSCGRGGHRKRHHSTWSLKVKGLQFNVRKKNSCSPDAVIADHSKHPDNVLLHSVKTDTCGQEQDGNLVTKTTELLAADSTETPRTDVSLYENEAEPTENDTEQKWKQDGSANGFSRKRKWPYEKKRSAYAKKSKLIGGIRKRRTVTGSITTIWNTGALGLTDDEHSADTLALQKTEMKTAAGKRKRVQVTADADPARQEVMCYQCGWCHYRAVYKHNVARHHRQLHKDKELDIVLMKSAGSMKVRLPNFKRKHSKGRSLQPKKHLIVSSCIPVVKCVDVIKSGVRYIDKLIHEAGVRKLCVDLLSEEEFITLAMTASEGDVFVGSPNVELHQLGHDQITELIRGNQT